MIQDYETKKAEGKTKAKPAEIPGNYLLFEKFGRKFEQVQETNLKHMDDLIEDHIVMVEATETEYKNRLAYLDDLKAIRADVAELEKNNG